MNFTYLQVIELIRNLTSLSVEDATKLLDTFWRYQNVCNAENTIAYDDMVEFLILNGRLRED